MIARRPFLVTLLILGLLSVPASAGAASARPAWRLQSLAEPTSFKPGDTSGTDGYEVFLTNSGAAATDGSDITIVDTLPKGIGARSIELFLGSRGSGERDIGSACGKAETQSEVTTVTCTIKESIPGVEEPAKLFPQEQMRLLIHTEVDAPVGALLNHVEVEGGGAEPAAVTAENQVSEKEATTGFQEFHSRLLGPDGLPIGQADGRIYAYVTSFGVNTELTPEGSKFPVRPAGGDLRNIEVMLPPGLVGNPMAIQRCTAQQFNSFHSASPYQGVSIEVNECPEASVVGVIAIQQLEGSGGVGLRPIYNLVPPPGMPAQLGFQVLGLPNYINTRLRSESDYGITAYLSNVTEAKRVTASTVTLWGTPGEAGHDRVRGICAELPALFPSGTCRAEGPVGPFFRLPSSCQSPLLSALAFETWARPATGATESDLVPALVGCAAPPFAPSIESNATTSVADAPSGLHFDLHNPQPQDPEAPGEADLRDATVSLPEGFVINPSSADGLGACSEAQVGYTGTSEGRPSFTAAPAECPDAAKVGTVAVRTPLVDHPLPGAVYLARQGENPFGSLLAIYITVDDPQTGVVVKLPGKVTPDPMTGRLTTTVEQSPQLPFEDFELNFFEGARAPLRTPPYCGIHTTTTALTPWSAPEGPTAYPQASFQTSVPAAGQTSCPTDGAALPATWAFDAGATAPVAGAYTPFTVHLSRPDGTQELSSLEVTLPPGVAARFTGVPECSDAQIAAAMAREVPGGGEAEEQSPSCPAASRIGSATVGAGAGPNPYYVTGDAYLAGPYKGAPFSIVVVTPAVAGPFDLGAVVVRSALSVDPFTAQGTVRSDPLPRVLDGIPLDVRSLAVTVDRPGFTINPTSCEAKSVAGTAVSVGGARTALTNRFQVGECAALAFKPKLKLSLKGSMKHAGHPALRAVLTYPKGGAYANIARAQVNLPSSEFIDQGNLNKTCTRPVLLEGRCPATTIYGRAKAWTPLLEAPLEGPVYLVGGFGYKLPALVAELNGQIRVLLVGKVDSGPNHGIRNTFEAVPDAPVEKFELRMKGGPKYSLLENSEPLCRKPQRAIARFTAQNGRVLHWKPKVALQCKKTGGKGKPHKSRHGKPGGHDKR
ncbi:MAG TPA: hypothetical protein VMF55_11275 [Solirubrobacterales bacterium]|nr:hypothetical protein [Solirubrobacterales bacterium]